MGEEGPPADPNGGGTATFVDKVTERSGANREQRSRALVIVLELRVRVHARNMDAPLPVRPRGNLAA